MEAFSSRLIKWHEQSGRKDLPWQLNNTPYKVWISEIMLQQTQVKTVIPYFERFINKFPDIPSLAESSLGDVLALWSGLGYYARARNIHKTANILKKNFNSSIPDELEELINLPGIGRSTAGAILSFGFNKKATILDGNVKRVISRYQNIQEDLSKNKTLNHLWKLVEELQPVEEFSTYNQALMDLGALVCKRTKPSCNICPVSTDCIARRNNTIHSIPAKNIKKTKPLKKIFWLLPYTNNGYVYLHKRKNNGLWGGLWSFIENEDFKALKKEKDGLFPDMKQKSLYKYTTITHSFSHYKLEADLYLLNIELAGINKKWIKLSQLGSLGLPKPIAETLKLMEKNGKISIL